MKKLTLLLLFFPLLSYAQKPDIAPLQWEEENIVHQSVIDLPGLDADQIFTYTKTFLIDAFKNYKEVVNAEEKELGLISGRGMTQSSYQGMISDTWDIQFSFKYEIKGEKLRVTFSNFEYMNPSSMRLTSLESLTGNALTKNYVKKLTGPQKQIFTNLGLNFESMNAELLESMKKSGDW